MTEKEVEDLATLYSVAIGNRMSAEKEQNALGYAVDIAKDNYIAGLYKLFYSAQKYHCPKCGNVMSLATDTYKEGNEVAYFMRCSACKCSSVVCHSELAALEEWKRVCDSIAREKQDWENTPRQRWVIQGMVPFHTEWVILARSANEAMDIFLSDGLKFDKESRQQNPSDLIERHFKYPYWYPEAGEHISGPFCEEEAEELKEEEEE